MRGGRLLLTMAAVLATAGVGHSQTSTGQSTGQKPSGDFYDMGNYDYFAAPPKAAPTPPQATPTPSPTAPPRASMPAARAAVPPPAAAAAAAVTPGNMSDAREQAKALAKPARAATAGGLTSTDLATALPGYTGGTLPQETLFDDPDALVSQGSAAAGGSDHYKTVINPDRTVVTIDKSELARAKAVETDPEAFLAGENLAGGNGSCRPLPPTTGGVGQYEATCNEGSKVTETPESCTPRLNAVVTNTLRYFYYGVAPNDVPYGFASTTVLGPKVAAGTCRAEQISKHICDAQIEMGAGGDDVERYRRFCKGRVRGNAQLYSCSAEIPGAEIPEHRNFATGTVHLRTEGSRSVAVTRNEGTCPSLEADSACTAQGGEVCTEGPETRMIDGVAVTQDCWAWRRGYMCQRLTQASDCADLAGNPACKFQREECLDDPQSGACKVRERVYLCPIPGGAPQPGTSEYICGDDVYCINGDCEPIEREASTEFKDAMVAVQTMGQANKEFDEQTLILFSGTRETCHRKVFGISNCCSGKGVPLVTAAICDAAEKQLDVKEEKGLCMKVGTYCSDEVLGVCVTRKEAHCCFESKLSRILQEQGRPQIGKPWAKPKTEQCKGFTVDEFARLDLSKMDFSEVYAEFMDAAKLPDEVGTTALIQKKIEEYYDRARP